MELSQYYFHLIDLLIDQQKPNGEFGKSRAPKVTDTVRNYHSEENLLDKPQSFVTMMAIEQLYNHDKEKYKKQINSALQWMHEKTTEGYFLSRAMLLEPTDSFVTNPQTTTQRIETIKVFRHTAEALSSFVQFDALTYGTITIVNNLLNAQGSDGGWSNTDLLPKSKLLSTTFCLQALSGIQINDYLQFIDVDQREEKRLQIARAINKGVDWLVQKNKEGNGFWYSPDVSEENKFFYSGIVLSRLPKLLMETCPNLVEKTIKGLIDSQSNGIWHRNTIPDYDGTARVVSALLKLMVYGNEIDSNLLKSSRNELFKHFESQEFIDPATLCYLIEVFSPNEELAHGKSDVRILPNINSNNIFISYRRKDSADVVGRIYDQLVEHFGQLQVFKDVNSIPLGIDFKDYISKAVGNSRVLLAVIGNRWLEADDTTGKPRLNDPDDPVRLEIESALAKDIPVIPLLVYGATFPSKEKLPQSLRKLIDRNGIQIRPDPDFHVDIERLTAALEKHIRK